MTAPIACPRCQTPLARFAVACFRCGFALEAGAQKTAFTAATSLDDGSSRLLDGRWLPLELFGTARSTTVWNARDVELDRRVHVKFLAPEVSADASAFFARELKKLARVDQPNVLTVLAMGEKDGQLYWVTPLVDGQSLSAKLEGGLPAEDALPIIAQVCEAVDAMHAEELFHRELASANARIDDFGHVVLLEPGIPRVVTAKNVTRMGWGLAEYAAPELYTGARPPDARTDVYALGCLLFEAITGKTPFASDDPQVMAVGHLNVAPPDITRLGREVPPALNAVLARALAKRAEDRFPTAIAFLRAAQAAVFPGLALAPAGLELNAPAAPEQPGVSLALAASKKAAEEKTEHRSAIKTIFSFGAKKGAAGDQTAVMGAPTIRQDGSTAELKTTRMFSGSELRRRYFPSWEKRLPALVLGAVVIGVCVLAAEYLREERNATTEVIPGPQPLQVSRDIPPAPAPAVELASSVTFSERASIGDVKLSELGELDEEGAAGASSAASPGGGRNSALRGLLRPAQIGEARFTATVKGKPEGAQLYVNNVYRGRTPLYLKLKTGIYKVKMTHAVLPPVVMELVVDTDKRGFEFEMELYPAIYEHLTAPAPTTVSSR